MKKSNFVNVLATSVVNPFDVLATCKDIAANKFGYGVIVRSEPKFKAPKKTASEWEEVFGTPMNITKVTKVTNARAYDYCAAVNRQLAKQGISDKFKGEKMLGYEWLVPNILKSSLNEGIADRDRMQFCITFKANDKTNFEHYYIVGGDHFATTSELEFIKSHLYVAPSKSKKQADMGIADEDIIMVRNYKVSNVVFCGKSDKVSEYWEGINTK